jgi:hypothetical protein
MPTLLEYLLVALVVAVVGLGFLIILVRILISSHWTAKGVRWIIAVICLMAFVMEGYDWLERRGMVSHQEESSITAEGNWFVDQQPTLFEQLS